MTEFKKHGKILNNLSNSGRTSKLTDRDRRALKRIVGRKHRTIAYKVLIKIVRLDLSKAGYHGRTAIRKPLLSEEVEVV